MEDKQDVEVDFDVLFKRLEGTRANINWDGDRPEYIEIGQYAGIDNKDDFHVERGIFYEVIGLLNEYSDRIKIVVFQMSLYSVNQEALLRSEDKIPEGDFEGRSLSLFDGFDMPLERSSKKATISFSTEELKKYRDDLNVAGFVDNERDVIHLPLNRILKIVIRLK